MAVVTEAGQLVNLADSGQFDGKIADNIFSIEMFEFRLILHWSLFLRV